MPLENNRGNLAAKNLGNLSVAVRAVQSPQDSDFLSGPTRTSSGSFLKGFVGRPGTISSSLHMDILIGRGVHLAYAVADCISKAWRRPPRLPDFQQRSLRCSDAPEKSQR
jgi:hypothetical protein